MPPRASATRILGSAATPAGARGGGMCGSDGPGAAALTRAGGRGSIATMQWAPLVAAGVLFVVSIVVLIAALSRLSRHGRSGDDIRLDDMQQRLAELTRLFRGAQTRGVIGETLLAELLRTWLASGQYELQYSFQSGAKADAAVRVGDRLVAVDAKFPADAISRAMEAAAEERPAGGAPDAALRHSPGTAAREQLAEARKAVLRHADAIAERYIRPAEGTLDFALLYLPSEALYRFLFVEQSPELFSELGARRVIPVSPGSLFLYIQTILFGLSGAAIPADRRELAQELEGIRSELHDFATLFYRAGSHLKNATKNFEEAESRLSHVERHLSTLLGRNRG